MTQCICGAETEQVTGGLESALHFLMLRLSARWVQMTFSYHAKRRRKKKTPPAAENRSSSKYICCAYKGSSRWNIFYFLFIPSLPTTPRSAPEPSQAPAQLSGNRKCLSAPAAIDTSDPCFHACPINDSPPSLLDSRSPLVAH